MEERQEAGTGAHHPREPSRTTARISSKTIDSLVHKVAQKKPPATPKGSRRPKKNRGSDLLSHPHHRSSTIGAGRLNDRVRKGSGCDPPAITTEKQKDPQTPHHHQQKNHQQQQKKKQCARTPSIHGGQALGLLVPVSSTPHNASTPGLSTRSSPGSLTPSKGQETSSRSRLPT